MSVERLIESGRSIELNADGPNRQRAGCDAAVLGAAWAIRAIEESQVQPGLCPQKTFGILPKARQYWLPGRLTRIRRPPTAARVFAKTQRNRGVRRIPAQSAFFYIVHNESDQRYRPAYCPASGAGIRHLGHGPKGRGRDGHRWPSPAQIRYERNYRIRLLARIRASKRASGYGCKMRGAGTHRSTIRPTTSHETFAV